jgi:membrane dipeptidase
MSGPTEFRPALGRPLIWDAHSCLPLHPDARIATLARHLDSGAHFVSVNIGMDFNPPKQILQVVASFREQIAQDPRMIQVECSDDVLRAYREGLLAVAFDLEGAVPLLGRTELVGLYSDLGVRQIHFAYNRDNEVAGGCHGRDQGLTPLGRRMVGAVNASGMIMDVSHTGYRSSMDIFGASSAPVVFSHANPAALEEHPRNISDDQIRACAATGGVVCINGVERFLGHLDVETFLRHLCYVAELVGAEHVGIGLDTMFLEEGLDDMPDGIDEDLWWPPEDYSTGVGRMGFLQPEHLPAIATGLNASDFSPEEIEGILGMNMLRIARQVWPS